MDFTSNYYNNNNNQSPPSSEASPSTTAVVEKEHMFDKVVTPSDVGKLNRLVIPKQHAEKYFPLDSSTNEKGLLLNFEDRSGKPWRFRYSYWNSSQSYVMTKGWSRFVKDKKLDAGDIVSFQRGVGESYKDRLYIDWRRRPDAVSLTVTPLHFPHNHNQFTLHRSVPWSPLLMRPPPNNNNFGFYNRPGNVNINVSRPVYYLRSPGEWPITVQPSAQYNCQNLINYQQNTNTNVNENERIVFDSVPVVQAKSAGKRLRLFGVNMECQVSDTTTTATSTTDEEDSSDQSQSQQLEIDFMSKGKGLERDF